MKKTIIGLAISSIFIAGTVSADEDYKHGVPFHSESDDAVGISSIADDSNGTLTITLTDGSSSSHQIPVSKTYNYRDYTSNATSKVFAVSGSSVDGSILGSLMYDTEVRHYDRTLPGQTSYSRDRKLGGENGIGVNYSVITLDTSGNELLLTKLERFNNAGTVLKETRIMTPGVIFRTENMETGKGFGSHSSLSSSKAGGSSVIQSVTLLGLEDVTVPAGSYTACLKILRHRNSSRLGGIYDRINWFCPNGIGLAKQVTMTSTTATTVTELKTITP